MTQRLVKLGSFAPGVNNRLEPTELDTILSDRSKGTYLYGAENVDIGKRGYVKRRRGQTLIQAGSTHSLWSDKIGSMVVMNDVLYNLTVFPDNTVDMLPVRAGLSHQPLSYSRGGDGEVYWSNGVLIRRVTSGGDAPVATEPPSLVPGISATTGALFAGKYLIAFTLSGPDGESPATPAVQITLGDNSGIAISTASNVNVFMSGPDGDILTYQISGSANIITHNEDGRICRTLNRAIMPAGQIVRHYNGRMLVASGSVLYISDPYNYGLYNPSNSYIGFAAPINLLEPTDNGLYIGADQTYFIADLFADKLRDVLPYGAIPFSSGQSPVDKTVYWDTAFGLIVADNNGTAKAVQSEALEFGDAASGASLYRQRDGMTHIVASRAEPGIASAAASSYMEARVIQKGTTL